MKVIIEITKTGWTYSIQDGEKVHSEKHISTNTGAQSEGELLEDTDLPEHLVEAVKEGFYCYDVMRALEVTANT